MPALVTSTMTKSLRAGKVFVDWSQNSGSKTTIAPYSLRGRTHPTVAAPRTWAELDDPALRQLSYDEVLTRIARDGDLLERLDADAPVADQLTRYRRMRDASKTPSRFPRRNPLPETAIRSSSRSITRVGRTTISGWNATACWSRGRYRKTCPTTHRLTI